MGAVCVMAIIVDVLGAEFVVGVRGRGAKIAGAGGGHPCGVVITEVSGGCDEQRNGASVFDTEVIAHEVGRAPIKYGLYLGAECDADLALLRCWIGGGF